MKVKDCFGWEKELKEVIKKEVEAEIVLDKSTQKNIIYNPCFGWLNFDVSIEPYRDKNKAFFEEASQYDAKVMFLQDENDYYNLLLVGENAIPAPVVAEIMNIQPTIEAFEERGFCFYVIQSRQDWDDACEKAREKEALKVWKKINCKKECQAVEPYCNDVWSGLSQTAKNKHRCIGRVFWCVSKEVAETDKAGKDYWDCSKLGVEVLDPEGKISWGYCDISEEVKASAQVKEVRPGDNWTCPHRRKWYGKNRVPNVVIPLPGGYAQINDGNGNPKAVISPEGRLTNEATVNIDVPLPEDSSQGIIYSSLLGNERDYGGHRGGRNLLERFIMLPFVHIVDEIADDEYHLSRVRFDQFYGSGKKVKSDGTIKNVLSYYRDGIYVDGSGNSYTGEMHEQKIKILGANWISERRWWNGGKRGKRDVKVKRVWLSQEIGGHESEDFKRLCLEVDLVENPNMELGR